MIGTTAAIIMGASAAASAYAAKKQADAAKTAAGQQQQAAETARTELQPYSQLGLNAGGALSYLMGLTPNANSQLAANASTPGGAALFPGGVGSPAGPAAGFLMQAPDGSQRMVAASDRVRAESLGAKVIDDRTGPSTSTMGWNPVQTPIGSGGSSYAAPRR